MIVQLIGVTLKEAGISAATRGKPREHVLWDDRPVEVIARAITTSTQEDFIRMPVNLRFRKKVTLGNKEMIPGKFCFDLGNQAKNQASKHRRAPVLKTT